MEKVKYKYIAGIREREHVPRKAKKAILGLNISKSKLRELLKSVKIGRVSKTMYERPEITPFIFCPKCGCRVDFGSGNMSACPEHWEEFRCARCRSITGYIDNSPFIHALECSENYYDPTF